MNENFKDETVMSLVERTIRRLWILCIILIALLVITNASWIYYENQFTDEVVVTQENEDGHNNYVDGDGQIIN